MSGRRRVPGFGCSTFTPTHVSLRLPVRNLSDYQENWREVAVTLGFSAQSRRPGGLHRVRRRTWSDIK